MSTTTAQRPVTRSVAPPHPGPRTVRLGRTTYELRGPSLRDPRLHNSAALLTVQACGQIWFAWELSIAQILVSIGTCASLELVSTARRRHRIAWPASALLTGNAIALLMRALGTEHGDWWSLHGWYYFAGTAALAMATKRWITVGGRHLFNPANLALVVAFVTLGTTRVNPQDFWFGPLSPGLVITYAVLIGVGSLVTRRLGLFRLATSFLAVFATCLAVLAVSGRLMAARWHVDPLGGTSYWWAIATSPEVLIFAFFMITDPKTTPAGRVARTAFGAAVGVCSTLLMAPQYSEFSVKVGFLAGLTIVTGAWPLVAGRLPRPATSEDAVRPWLRARLSRRGPDGPVLAPARVLGAAASVAAVGALLVVLTVATPPASTPATAADLGARPEIAVDEAALPTVRVSDEVASIMGAVSDEEAQDILVDALADLEIERRAVAAADADLAATATTGARLDALEAAISGGDAGATLPAATVTGATLGLSRSGEQAMPRLQLELEGTTDDGGRPFAVVLSLAQVGGHHLIEAVAEQG